MGRKHYQTGYNTARQSTEVYFLSTNALVLL